MNRKAGILKYVLFLFSTFVFFSVFGCKNSPTGPLNTQSSTDSQAMLKIAQSDSTVSSFSSNYNEDDTMDISSGDNDNICPFRVGQKLRLVSSNLNYTAKGDTAYGKYTQTFEGVLYVADSVNYDSLSPDSLIQKPFTTIITRNIIFVKKGNSNRPILNWKIVEVSLPEGGTVNSNVNITNMILYLSSGDTISVSNPNDYYLYKGFGREKHIPEFNPGRKVTIQVEINSAYADTDFVTLTHGADFRGMHREKVKFNLISSTPAANGYNKIYRGTFMTNRFPGYFHAVINAYSKQAVFDNSSPVELSSWGVPYFVK